MKRGARVLPVLALGVAATQLALLTGEVGLVGLCAAPALLSPLRQRRFALTAPAQVLLLIACALGGFVLTSVHPLGAELGSEPLRATPATLALAALMLASLRLHIAEPEWGLAGTLGIGLCVFLACGTVQSGRLYPTALLLYGPLSFAALAAAGVERGERPARGWRDRRLVSASALLLLLAAGLSLSLAGAVPALYHAAYRWGLRMVDPRTASGFHDGAIHLGALHGMLQSDEIVARVEGDAGEHLRGNVYQIYRRGRWLPGRGHEERSMRVAPVAEPGDGEPALRARVRFASEDLDRFFLPDATGRLQLEPADVRVDGLGVVRPNAGETALQAALLPGQHPALRPAAPAPVDLEVPESISPGLEELVGDWTRGLPDARARIDALRAQLEARYRYSLDVPGTGIAASGSTDPVLGFLLETRAGHCEYFASAMTLLARSAGVPARLVTGYRVVEHNPYGDYHIVRERHAHAWTEVHLPGEGWMAVDPSPALGTSQPAAARTTLVAGLLDYAGVLAGRWGAEALLAALVVGLASLQVRRLLSERGGDEVAERPGVDPAPAYLEALLGWLSARGIARHRHEPIEAFARRIRRTEPSDPNAAGGLLEASLLLQRYSAFRYGGIGSGELLARDVLGWLDQQPT